MWRVLVLFAPLALSSLASAQEQPAVQVRIGFGPADPFFGNRRAGRRMLRVDPAAAKALEDGLNWLKRHQSADGPLPVGDTEHEARDTIVVTALATLAFVADGSTMRSGPHKDQIKRGVKWLRSRQRADGAFGPRDAKAGDLVFCSALGTLAMSEAYSLSRYKTLKKTCRNGANFLIQYRLPDGSFHPNPKSKVGDPALTLWCTWAHRAFLRGGGIQVVESKKVLAWVDSLKNKRGVVRPRPMFSCPLGFASKKAPHPMVQECEAQVATMLTEIFLGRPKANMKGGLAHLRKTSFEWKKGGTASAFEWYCANLVLRQLGGAGFKDWPKTIHDQIVKAQVTKGDDVGSWDPIGPWGETGGRAYSTALMTMALTANSQFAMLAEGDK